MGGYAVEARRGFGAYRDPLASGVGGERQVKTMQLISISHRLDFCRFGFCFPLAENMCKSIQSPNFGPYARAREKGDCVLLGDFRVKPRDRAGIVSPRPYKACAETASENQ